MAKCFIILLNILSLKDPLNLISLEMKISVDELIKIKDNNEELEVKYEKELIFYIDDENNTPVQETITYVDEKDEIIKNLQKTGTFEHSFRKHLNSVYTFI